MGDNGSSEKIPQFVCFRCGKGIPRGEKMFRVELSIDIPAIDGSLEYSDGFTIAQLCFGCVSVILAEFVISKKLVMPECALDEIQVE
jgi:hypothetical protein